MSSLKSDLGTTQIGLECRPQPPQIAERSDIAETIAIPDDETSITEISFLPDGRICLFGASREVLELLGALNLGDDRLGSRLRSLGQSDIQSTAGITYDTIAP